MPEQPHLRFRLPLQVPAATAASPTPASPAQADFCTNNGQGEYRRKPVKLSGSNILNQLNGVLIEYKKNDLVKRKIEENKKGTSGGKKFGWKKRSVFFDLLYWEHNLIRHNLDIIHIEKNICNDIL